MGSRLNHGPLNNQPHTSIGADTPTTAMKYEALPPLTPKFDV